MVFGSGWLGWPAAAPASRDLPNHEILVLLVHYNGLLVFYWYLLVLLVQFYSFSIKPLKILVFLRFFMVFGGGWLG